MTYQEAIDWLYSTQQFGIKLGLDQPRRLLRETNSLPNPGVKVIHVAGTNGKGSTCVMIDALARACGTRTGLFTSPHLIDYRERVRVNGDEISEQTTAHYLSEMRELVADWEHHPTFFELTLAVGMRYFKEQHCDLIILETGMGGRLDATTAVPADLAVITPIAMDHAQWLGDTLAAVATEKAGIIVPGKPVISSWQEPAAHSAIERHADERSSPIEFIDEPLTGFRVNLPGRHQLDNAALAVAATQRVGLPLDDNTIHNALGTVSWPGRFERLVDSNIILDAAHNPHAAKALVETWKEQYPSQKATIIFGAVEDKNTHEILTILSEMAKHIHLTPIDSPRSLTSEQLAEVIAQEIPHTIHNHLADALRSSKTPSSNDPTLICGSIFLIGQAKALLRAQSAPVATSQ